MRIGITIAVGAVAATTVCLGPVQSAFAANDSGNYTCGGLYAPRLQSDTLGNTVHRWTNNATAATKKSEWAAGGVHASVGYAGVSNHWVLTAPTISSDSLSCIN